MKNEASKANPDERAHSAFFCSRITKQKCAASTADMRELLYFKL